jgi:hypothetical protein
VIYLGLLIPMYGLLPSGVNTGFIQFLRMKFHDFQKIRGGGTEKSVRLHLHLNKICNMQNVKEYEVECAAGCF